MQSIPITFFSKPEWKNDWKEGINNQNHINILYNLRSLGVWFSFWTSSSSSLQFVTKCPGVNREHLDFTQINCTITLNIRIFLTNYLDKWLIYINMCVWFYLCPFTHLMFFSCAYADFTMSVIFLFINSWDLTQYPDWSGPSINVRKMNSLRIILCLIYLKCLQKLAVWILRKNSIVPRLWLSWAGSGHSGWEVTSPGLGLWLPLLVLFPLVHE